MGNYQQFNFNQEAAMKADGGGRIETTGKYVGRILHAEFVTSKGGTQGIEFHFQAHDEASTTFTLWTHKSSGETIFGYDKVNALLACAGVRTLTPTNRTLEKYDYDTKQKIQQPCVVAPELDNAPIGLLLQRENYQNNNGEWRYQMNFYAAFKADSEFMAAEILNRETKAVALEKVMNRLVNAGDATRKPASGQAQNNQPQSNGYGQQQGGYAQRNNNASSDLDDDLPF